MDKEYRNRSILAFEMGKAFEWEMWINKIPPLKFPSHWEIKIIPPFNGALVRFCAITNRGSVSVFLDAYGMCSGSMPNKPYWEIYPYTDDEPKRFWMEETDKLINAIKEVIG